MKKFSGKQTGVLSASDLKTPKGKALYWIFFAILVLTAAISLLPAIWTYLPRLRIPRRYTRRFRFFLRKCRGTELLTESRIRLSFCKSAIPL